MSHVAHPSRRFMLSAAMPLALGFGLPSVARALSDQAPPVQAQSAEAPPDLAVYGKLPAIENVALSPNGQRVVMLMEKDGERRIYDVDLASGKASAAAIATDKVRQLMWADDDHVLVVTSSTGRAVGDVFEEWFGLIFDVPGGKRTQMYQYVRGVTDANVYGDFFRIKTDNKYFVTAAGWKIPDGLNMANSDGGGTSYSGLRDRCLYAFDPGSSGSHMIDEDARVIQDWVLLPDGTPLAAQRIRRRYQAVDPEVQ